LRKKTIFVYCSLVAMETALFRHL